MERDKQIFLSMVFKTVLDRYLEDAMRRQQTVEEALDAFDHAKVQGAAELYYDDFLFDAPAQALLQDEKDWVPALDPQNAPYRPQPQQAPQAAPQPQYAPQYGPQPIQNELPPQGSTAPPVLWESGPNDHIPPAEVNGANWIDYIPFKKRGEICHSSGKEWAETSYRDILATFQVELESAGKPKYQSDWSKLSWLIKAADLSDQKWGKQNRYKVAQLKGVMLEVARRRPPGPVKPRREPSQGRYIPDAQETAAAQAGPDQNYGYPPDQQVPF